LACISVHAFQFILCSFASFYFTSILSHCTLLLALHH